MEIELKIKKQYDVKYLLAEVGARYWEDSSVNGVDDEKGDLIPCRDGEFWKPLIDIETGQILNWEKGKTARVHYKSCDHNQFKILDTEKKCNYINRGVCYFYDVSIRKRLWGLCNYEY